MLSFQDFFIACAGVWTTERTYHSVLQGEIERSYTKFRFYNRSVAVDQMRFVAPDLRMRTIVTYQRPADGSIPTVIDLIGFGVERKQ